LRTSPAGTFLDSVLDRVADAVLLAALAVAAGAEGTAWLAFGAALFGSLAVPFVKAAYQAAFGRPLPPSTARIGVGRDVRLLLVALCAIALQPLWGLIAVAVLANLEAARRFAIGWRSRGASGPPSFDGAMSARATLADRLPASTTAGAPVGVAASDGSGRM
jgi:phosphatidylglycerophosphate synthase